MKILIFYQHELREGIAYHDLAQFLRSKGLRVCFTRSGRKLFFRLLIFRPSLVIGPWVTTKLIRYCTKARLSPTFINMYEEQTQLIDSIQSTHCRQLIKSHHFVAWNSSIARKASEINENLKTHVIGSIRHSYDFFNKKSICREELSERYNIDPSDQLILVAMDYAILFNEKRQEKAIAQGLVDQEYLDVSQNVLERFREFLLNNASIHKNTHFIIRPHPGTGVDQMEEYLGTKKIQNISVIDDFGITDWLKIVDKYMTRLSSSINEAKIYNLPTCLMYRNISNQTIDSYSHIRNSKGYTANNNEELNKFISNKPSDDSNKSDSQTPSLGPKISKNIREDMYRIICDYFEK